MPTIPMVSMPVASAPVAATPPVAVALPAAAPCPSRGYNEGFAAGLATCGLTSSDGVLDSYPDPDAPAARRMRRTGALPVHRAVDGDLIATCRRRHCLKRFNVNDNSKMQCGYHPVPPTTTYEGDYYPCCGVLVRPGAHNVFCQFRAHLA